MKLDIPFYKQNSKMNCGPTALRIVISFFDKDPGIEAVEEKSKTIKDKGVATIQIGTTAVLMGYKADFYSKKVHFDDSNKDMDFYKEHSEVIERMEEFIKDAEEAGVEIHEKTLELDEILSKLSDDCVPIILLDWNVITGNREKGYHGHFVPIVGYDEENVYIHNQGEKNPEKFMKVERELFDEARKSKGTDEDVVFIRRR